MVVRKREASPAPPRAQAEVAPESDAALPAEESQDGAAPAVAKEAPRVEAVATSGADSETAAIVAWIVLLCVSQLAMFIYGKKAMQFTRLPTLLCFVQFGLSFLLTLSHSLCRGAGWRSLAPLCAGQKAWMYALGVCWTMGFVLLNASVANMSASLVATIRALEPLSTVSLGFLFFGEKYSARLLLTLALVCAGVATASSGGGTLSFLGVALASLSNFGFSSRVFFTKKLGSGSSGKLDSTSIFLNVMCIGCVVLTCLLLVLEGAQLRHAFLALRDQAKLSDFASALWSSGVSFFFYQLAQIKLMAAMSTVAFSVITPMSKAFVIVACAVYFGDNLGIIQVLGIVLSTVGVLLFTSVRRADVLAAQKAAEGKRD